MENHLKRERASTILFVTCWIVYAIICMARNAFSVSIAPITSDGLLNKSEAGVISGFYYLFYGSAQLLLVRIVDKISPFKLINIALFGSLISLGGFFFANSYPLMLILWCAMGIFQFACWPSVIRIITQYLLPDHRPNAMISIAFAICSATLANYLLASIVLKFFSWRIIFAVLIALIICAAILWTIVTNKTVPVLEKFAKEIKVPKAKVENTQKSGLWKVIFTSGLLFLLIPTFIRGMLDTGLKSWVPTMIVENYGTSTSFASILTTILLLINLFGIFILNLVYPKHIKSEAICLAMCFVVALPFTALLLLIGKIPVLMVVVLLTTVTTFTYAGSQLVNVIIPSKFAKMNVSGGVASVINAVASFGALAANSGFGFMADRFGWTATIWSWNILMGVAIIFAFLSIQKWNKFVNK